VAATHATATLMTRPVQTRNGPMVTPRHHRPDPQGWEPAEPDSPRPLASLRVAAGPVVVEIALADAVGLADPGGADRARLHEAVHRHRRHPQVLRNLGHGQEPRSSHRLGHEQPLLRFDADSKPQAARRERAGFMTAVPPARVARSARAELA